MRTTISVLMLLAAGLLFLPGCPQVPEGTTLIDLDGDGRADALARDADGDGQPDVDAEGNFQVVAGTRGYKIAEATDAIMPILLTVLGTIFGGGSLGAILMGLGVAWRSNKLGRRVMNLVMSVQAARDRLGKEGGSMKTALEIVNETLAGVQDPETEKLVADVKEIIAKGKAAKEAKVLVSAAK